MHAAVYEVQFLDGLGCWRRWSLRSTPASAEFSRASLVRFLGGMEHAARIIAKREVA